MSNSSNANKWKYYIDKSKVKIQADMHCNVLNNIVYKVLKAEIKNNYSVQGVNNVPKNISDTIKKAIPLLIPIQLSSPETVKASPSCKNTMNPVNNQVWDVLVMSGVKYNVFSIKLNKMGVLMLISAIQTPVLQMVANILVRQNIFYILAHTSPRIREHKSISK